MKSQLLNGLVLGSAISTLGACAGNAEKMAEPKQVNAATLMPALRTSNNDQDLIELRQAIGQLSGSSIDRLPATAFKNNARIALSREPMSPANSAPPKGDTANRLAPIMPVIFELMTDGDACYLYSLDSEQTTALEHVKCSGYN